MFISYKEIVKKYDLRIEKILHVGAHLAEEHDDYFSNGCKQVIWIEANPDLVEIIKNKIPKEKNIIFNNVVSDKDGEEVSFMITNNGQSSSFLELGTHKNLYPHIFVNKQITLFSKKIETLFKEKNISFENLDFINLDIQGAELLALKGIGENLKFVKAIYTEINVEEVYKNCALVNELDDYLLQYNFKRVETFLDSCKKWGDALYIKG